jgi:putative aldouronate transport system substrate-binding protein
MAVFYQDTVKMTYQALEGGGRPTSEYVAADGVTYREGDFKPVWAELQKRLNFTINDVTPADATTRRAAFTSLSASGFSGVDIMVGNPIDTVQEAITNGTYVALDEYLDVMPNLNAFLNNNGVVKTAVTSGDGHIYFAPYFDGYDDLENMFILRAD